MASAENKRHLFVNSAYETIMGLSADELQVDPLDWLKIVHPADRERVRRHLTEPKDRVDEEEFRIDRPDGTERWLKSRLIPILNDQYQVYMNVGMTEDITEQKRAEERLARRRTQLSKATRFNILGETVAGVTHEITQPLTAISNFASACAAILEKRPCELTELREYIDEIRSQSTRAGKIVQSLRSLARRTEPHRELSNLNMLIAEAISLLHADLRQSRVEMRLDLDPRCPQILVDRVQLQQVVVNLLRNACDALQNITHGERSIVLRTRALPDWIELECTDNGPGFSKSHESRMFQAFFTTKPDGMGMGMAICRTIVEAHGGRISASNHSAGGASVRVTFPTAVLIGEPTV
jgi:PAS domain S-box-containing protein